MREIRPSGSEGGEAGNLTGLPYPYHDRPAPLVRIYSETTMFACS